MRIFLTLAFAMAAVIAPMHATAQSQDRLVYQAPDAEVTGGSPTILGRDQVGCDGGRQRPDARDGPERRGQ